MNGALEECLDVEQVEEWAKQYIKDFVWINWAKPRTKEIISLIKQPENQDILCKAFYDLSQALPQGKGSEFIIPADMLPDILKQVNLELSVMLGLSPRLYLNQNPIIKQDDSKPRSYFHPPKITEYEELQPVISICSEDMTRHAVYTTVAHELVHLFQQCKKLEIKLYWTLPFLKEGFARGVERLFAENKVRKYRDTSFLHSATAALYEDLNEFASNGYKENPEQILHPEGHWGSCAFVIAEARHGKGIYRDMMDSDNPYEMLVEMLGGRR